MEIIAAFVAGALLGAGSLITWALCAANTMYEEKLKKVKTNEDMLKLADSEQLRKALKRLENDNVFKPFIEGGTGKTY